LKCCCRPWPVRSFWKPAHAQQLLGIHFSALAATEGKADDMDPIAVNNNKLALEEVLQQKALFADGMSQLHFQANIL